MDEHRAYTGRPWQERPGLRLCTIYVREWYPGVLVRVNRDSCIHARYELLLLIRRAICHPPAPSRW